MTVRKKYSLITLLMGLVLFSGCNKDCESEPNLTVNQAQLENDIASIDAFLASRNIDAETHPSGIRYVVSNAGSGDRPSLCDRVVVGYSGRLLGNTINFDSSEDPVFFTLNNLIVGWQIGIPLIKSGGRITLYIPSVYGYGTRGSGPDIPPNSNLEFTIQLYGID